MSCGGSLSGTREKAAMSLPARAREGNHKKGHRHDALDRPSEKGWKERNPGVKPAMRTCGLVDLPGMVS